MLELPTGTVTFLFTDIQGSTSLWEQMPEEMHQALALHHALLHQAIKTSGGVVFKIIGDSFQAAFPLAGQALDAALAAQLALLGADWQAKTGPLKVRMGLHTGTAEIERTSGGSDYAVSHTLNRVARIMSAGYGGQILLSHETANLVERDLPPGVTLKDLGEHQLKGMARLEQLFQVCAPGLPDDFPPLTSGVTHPNNLPTQLSSFIGRETELEALQRLVTSGTARLVTLTGPGGTGKTRLALQAAENLLETFPDGIWLVELAPLADPALIPPTVTAALGLHETPGIATTQRLIDYLYTQHLLLILDNCEHLVETAARLAEQLLQACPRLQILATSREILGTQGETPFRVPSLALPGSQNLPLEDLANCESIHLFVERARTAAPTFSLTAANAPLVVRICQRLDGIPLAIELAAARVRLLSVEQIAARLDDSFRLLTGGSRTVLSRHQTLRALIDWSYNLLSPEERALFLRLSVFAGGCTLEAAEHVCADLTPKAAETDASVENSTSPARISLDPDAILDLLSQLVDKSLVIPAEGPVESGAQETGNETRYRMLETIRQYAREKLHEEGGGTTGGGATIRNRHLAYFLLLAEEAEPYLRSGSQVAWLDRLEAELDNLRLALEWSLAGRIDEGLSLSAALLWFWHIRGHGREGIEWLDHLLAAGAWPEGGSASPRRRLIRARALIVAGFLKVFQSRAEQGEPALEQAVTLLRELGQSGRRWLGVALMFLSKWMREHNDRTKLLEEALPLLREAGDPLFLAEYWMELGGLLVDENKIEQAMDAFRESLALREASQDLDGLGTAALQLGDTALFRRDYAECEVQYENSLTFFRQVKNKTMESILLSRLGNIDMLTGNYSGAANRFEARIALNQQIGDRFGMANSLFDLGRLDFNNGEYMQGSRRFADIARIGIEIDSKHAVLIGLLFQGLAALGAGDEERREDFTQQAITFWRRAGQEPFSQDFIAGSLENLAVLLSSKRPELAARLFSAVDQSGLVTRVLNTTWEVSMYQTARTDVQQTLGEQRFAAAWDEGQRMSVNEALALVLQA